MYNYRNVPNSMTHQVSKNYVRDISLVRSRLMHYLIKLGIDTPENMVEFYQFYFCSVVSFIPGLIRSNFSKQEMFGILDDIHTIELFKTGLKLPFKVKLLLRHRIRLFLLVRRKYELLIIYEKVIYVLKVIKRFVTNKNNK